MLPYNIKYNLILRKSEWPYILIICYIYVKYSIFWKNPVIEIVL